MRAREKERNKDNINKVINGIRITEARHEKLKSLLKNHFGVEWKEIISKSRAARIVKARRHYFYVMRYVFLYTLEHIGEITNKTHATVIYNLKTQDTLMDLYTDEKQKYKKIKKIMLERASKKEIKERVEYLQEQKAIIQRKIDELLMSKKRINELLTK